MNIRKNIAAFLSVCISGSALCSFTVNADNSDSPGIKFDTWQDAYVYFLKIFPQGKEEQEDRELGFMYEVKDITGDGIPELFISEGVYPTSDVTIYTYKNGEAEYITSGGAYGSIGCNNDKSHEGIYFITSFMNMGIQYFGVELYNNGGTQKIAEFTTNEISADELNPAEYNFNGNKVTKEEYDKELSKYTDLDIDFLGRKVYFDELYTRIDGVTYHNYFDHYEVTGADIDAKDIKIADEVSGTKVTKIHNSSMQNFKNLESVTFGNNIERIGKNAFDGCISLKSVTIPENVKDIDEQAFIRCSSLEEVAILNPECSIWDFWEGGQPTTFCNTVDENGKTSYNGVIKGQDGSMAQKYAKIFDLKFEEIAQDSSAELALGDINNDKVIDGKDATAILTAYAKSSVAGSGSGLTAAQTKAADVNYDNIIDGKDATSVLTYYARSSVGISGTLEEFMNYGYGPDAVVYGNYRNGLVTVKDAEEFLNGQWKMIPHGNDLAHDDSSVDISIDSKNKEINFTRSKEYAKGYFELKDLWGGLFSACNLMPIKMNTVSANFTEKPSSLLDIVGEYQFIGTYMNGRKMLAVRDVNGKIAQLSAELGESNAVNNDFWVFEENVEDAVRVSDEDNEKMKIKGKTFDAFRWYDSGDMVYLQEMTTGETILDGNVKDEKFNVMYYCYDNRGGHGMTAVAYKVKDSEKLANTGSYKPGLVKVTTDSDGNITEMKEYEYLSMGVYLAD